MLASAFKVSGYLRRSPVKSSYTKPLLVVVVFFCWPVSVGLMNEEHPDKHYSGERSKPKIGTLASSALAILSARSTIE